MTPTKHERDEVRPTRATLLIGSAMALLCLGAGVASAQTAVPAVPEAPATQDGQLAPAGEPATDDDAPTAGEETTAGEDTAVTEEQTAGDGSGEGDTSDGKARRDIPRLLLENVTPGQIYFAGKRRAEFNYKHGGAGRVDLRIEAVKKGSGKVIKAWRRNDVPPDTKQQLRWDGRKRGGGHVRKGRFFFRVETAGGASLNRKRASGQREFWIRPAIFPVRGRHQYWDGFGAGRGHQGQDIGASCGTKLVAAEPGRVVYKAFNGGGWGYYVVIKVRGRKRSELYAHMKRPAAVRDGQRVKTGQKVGVVGSTGSSTGCHLHFEYRKGGWPGTPSPRVTKRLRTWDSWS